MACTLLLKRSLMPKQTHAVQNMYCYHQYDTWHSAAIMHAVHVCSSYLTISACGKRTHLVSAITMLSCCFGFCLKTHENSWWKHDAAPKIMFCLSLMSPVRVSMRVVPAEGGVITVGCAEEQDLTVGRLNELLDALAGAENAEARKNLFRELIDQCVSFPALR